MAHLDLLADPIEDETFLYRRGALERLVNVALELDSLPAPPAAIGSDNQLGFGVVDPINQGLRGEAAEDNGVDRADSRARQHRNCRFGH